MNTDILLADLGNSRNKWRLGQRSGHAASIDEMARQLAALPCPDQILACVVGRQENEFAAMTQALWQRSPRWLKVSRQALGVTNHYHNLDEQGCDRWAAVLGARSRFPAQNLLVVSAGTALVVDTLTARGDFMGGTIAPGLGLMKTALHQATARLPQANGHYQPYPQATLDAIETGCQRALLGSIQAARLQLELDHGPLGQVLLFGGDAALIAARLNAPCQTVDNLVLDGLAALALHQQGDFRG